MIEYNTALIIFKMILGIWFFLNGFGWYFGDSDMKDKNDIYERLLRKILGVGWFIIVLLL